MASAHCCFFCLETLGRRGGRSCGLKGFSRLWWSSEQRSARRLATASLAAGRWEAREGNDDDGMWNRTQCKIESGRVHVYVWDDEGSYSSFSYT